MPEAPTEKVTRISISLPSELDAKMRRLAAASGETLSAMFRQAALLKLRNSDDSCIACTDAQHLQEFGEGTQHKHAGVTQSVSFVYTQSVR